MSEQTVSKPIKSWALVMLQFILLGALVLLSDLRSGCLPCWGLIIASAALGLWAIAVMGYDNFNIRPDVKQNARLIHARLPYARIRHPMYSSVFLFSLGFLFAPFSGLKLILVFALFIVMVIKARYEEQLLVEKFPDYADYQARTQRFVPFVY